MTDNPALKAYGEISYDSDGRPALFLNSKESLENLKAALSPPEIPGLEEAVAWFTDDVEKADHRFPKVHTRRLLQAARARHAPPEPSCEMACAFCGKDMPCGCAMRKKLYPEKAESVKAALEIGEKYAAEHGKHNEVLKIREALEGMAK